MFWKDFASYYRDSYWYMFFPAVLLLVKNENNLDVVNECIKTIVYIYDGMLFRCEEKWIIKYV